MRRGLLQELRHTWSRSEPLIPAASPL